MVTDHLLGLTTALSPFMVRQPIRIGAIDSGAERATSIDILRFVVPPPACEAGPPTHMTSTPREARRTHPASGSKGGGRLQKAGDPRGHAIGRIKQAEEEPQRLAWRLGTPY